MEQNDIAIKRSIKTITIVMGLVLIAKISGFIRDVLVLRYMGDSPEGTAFALASQIPRNFLDVAFAAAISAGFIPVFNFYLERKTKDETFALANNFITFVMVLSLAATAIGFLAAGPIANLHLMNEGGPEATALMRDLLRIKIFTVFTAATAFSLVGVLQSLGRFYIPSIMSLVPNILVLAYLALFFERFGVIGLAAAFIIGNVLQLTILLPPLRKQGFVYRPLLVLNDPGLLKILRLTPMVLVSAWLFPINNAVNNLIMSNHRPEAVVELTAANTIYLVVTGFFVLSVTNVLFPKLSREAAKDKSQFAGILSGAISGVVFLLFPMAAGLWLLRQPLFLLTYYGGEFSAQSAQNAAHAMGFLVVGMLGFGLTTILSRAFFSIMDGKTPMFASLAAIILNAGATLLLVAYLDIAAPALASALSVTLAGVVMLVVMAKKYPIISFKIVVNLGKMLLSAAIMTAVLLACMQAMHNLPDLLTVGIICLLGVLLYFGVGLLLNINEAKMAKNMLLARLRPRKDA